MANMSSKNSNLSPKFSVMGFVYIHPMHGYEVHKLLETSLREVWHISESQVYNILKNLEKDAWITRTQLPQEKRPDKELLFLTDLGKREFENWLFQPTPGSARAIRVEFLTRLYFASNVSDDLPLRFVREQVDSIRASLIDLHARLASIPSDQVFNRMGLELRIIQLEAILVWMEKLPNYLLERKSSLH